MKRKVKKIARRKAAKKPETSTAIVPTPPAAPVIKWNERRLSQDKIDLLKRTVAKGTSDDQFALFMNVCQRHGLDPFTKQIYCVMFPVSKHHQDENGIWHAGHDMVIMTGIDGYRKMAARDHKDFAGSSAAKFTWFEDKRQTPAKRLIPESATVQILRRGTEPTTATVYWEEFAPKELLERRSDFWNRMPKTMLEKCAEAKGLRKAFPGLGDVFTDVEMSQRLQDFTPGGRQITDEEGFAPSGTAITHNARLSAQHQAAENVVEAKLRAAGRWCEKHRGDSRRCPADDHTAAENEALGAAEHKVKEPAIPPPAQQSSPRSGGNTPNKAPETPAAPSGAPPKYTGTIELDLQNPEDPILRGDLGNVIQMVEKHCTANFHDGWWHITPKDRQTIEAMCHQLNFQLRIVEAPAKPRANKTKEPEVATEVVTGTIDRVHITMAGQHPMAQITLVLKDGRKPTFGSFDKDIYGFLDKGKGKITEVFVQKRGNFTNIVGLKRIGEKEFIDGKVPVTQRSSQEAGGKTLFGV